MGETREAMFSSNLDVFFLDSSCNSKLRVFKQISRIIFPVPVNGPDNAEHACNALIYRETLGSTGLGDGLAIPHARVNLGPDFLRMGFVRTVAPIEWEAYDGKPVSIIAVWFIDQSAMMLHFRVIKHLHETFETLRTRGLFGGLMKVNSSTEIIAIFRTCGCFTGWTLHDCGNWTFGDTIKGIKGARFE